MKKNYLKCIGVLFFFTSMSYAQDSESIVNKYLRGTFSEYRKSDLMNFTIDGKDYSKSLRGEVIKVQQMYNGLPVFNAVSTVLVKDNRVTYFLDSFEKDYLNADQNIPRLNPQQAFDKLASTIELKNSEK
ncbi:hypothetical protein D1631_12960 [Chryseobacterium nematophagum]|uniref:FTP domain-containing protein n=1 Tax=Chryseobacterium nematophagum TaxID=2305228 RepID=A0A3M7TJE4_9FLAO|nr:hypothetical protein [Chryseobacterium nematophagum]RNA62779.1 hypothetical protein D1631_12960 [Chryseobacterium nematophagum]